MRWWPPGTLVIPRGNSFSASWLSVPSVAHLSDSTCELHGSGHHAGGNLRAGSTFEANEVEERVLERTCQQGWGARGGKRLFCGLPGNASKGSADSYCVSLLGQHLRRGLSSVRSKRGSFPFLSASVELLSCSPAPVLEDQQGDPSGLGFKRVQGSGPAPPSRQQAPR